MSWDYDDPAFWLSMVTTLLCLGLKLPQIQLVVTEGSVRGLSCSSLLLEFWCYMTVVSYSRHSEHPIQLIAEYPFLLTQDLILIWLLFVFDNKFTVSWFSLVATMITTQFFIASRFAPIWLPYAAITISSPVGLVSKFLQLRTIYTNKDSGQVSTWTWGLNCVSSLARLFSYVLSVPDMTIMVTLTFSSLLNGAVAGAAYYYRRPVIKQE